MISHDRIATFIDTLRRNKQQGGATPEAVAFYYDAERNEDEADALLFGVVRYEGDADDMFSYQGDGVWEWYASPAVYPSGTVFIVVTAFASMDEVVDRIIKRA